VVGFLAHSLSLKEGVHIYNYVDKPDMTMNQLVSCVRLTLFGKENVGLKLPSWLGLSGGWLLDIVSRVSGREFPVSMIRIKKFMATTQFNTAAKDSGFVPQVTLRDGIKKTLEYEFLEDNSDKPTYETE
jgi:nucleoside-diphosphate-sugar epimerase